MSRGPRDINSNGVSRRDFLKTGTHWAFAAAATSLLLPSKAHGLFDSVFYKQHGGQYSLSQISYVRSFTTNSTNIGILRGVYLSPDGTKMYLIGRGPSRYIAQYSLSTPFDISTSTYVNRTAGDAGSTGPTDLWIKGDGTKLYECGSGYDGCYERTFGTAWDITTLSVQGAGNYMPFTNMAAIAFDGSGTYLMGGQGSTGTKGYHLSASYNITSPTLLGSVTESTSCVSLSYAGDKMMRCDNGTAYEYAMSSTGNPNTGRTLANTKDLAAISGDGAIASISGMHVTILAASPYMNKYLYVVDSNSQKVWQFKLW